MYVYGSLLHIFIFIIARKVSQKLTRATATRFPHPLYVCLSK